MKKLGILLMMGILALVLVKPALASQWDVAGKVLTGVEGVRIITGGKVDPIGQIIGVFTGQRQGNQGQHGSRYARGHEERSERVWVPHYVWKQEYVPAHEEYNGRGGKIIVSGHYIRYQVESGGHWETRYERNDGRENHREGRR
jgi:hypothetical protein